MKPSRKKFLFGSLILLATLVLTECGLRLYLTTIAGLPIKAYHRFGYDRSPLVGFEMIPNLKNVSIDSLKTTYSTNSRGFRSKIEYGPKAPNELRVAILGDSTPFGFGATNDDTTIGAYLEKSLAQSFPGRKISVINAANPSYVTYQAFAKYLTQVSDLKPDYVFVYTGWNDMMYSFHTLPDGNLVDRTNFVQKNIFFTLDSSWQDYIESQNTEYSQTLQSISKLPFIRSLALTVFARRAGYVVKNFNQKKSADSPVYIPAVEEQKEAPISPAAISQFENFLSAFSASIKANGATPILSPLVNLGSYRKPYRDQLNQSIVKVAERTGALIVPSQELSSDPKSESFFNPVDFYHFTDAGNEKMAGLIQEQILSHSLSQKGPQNL